MYMIWQRFSARAHRNDTITRPPSSTAATTALLFFLFFSLFFFFLFSFVKLKHSPSPHHLHSRHYRTPFFSCFFVLFLNWNIRLSPHHLHRRHCRSLFFPVLFLFFLIEIFAFRLTICTGVTAVLLTRLLEIATTFLFWVPLSVGLAFAGLVRLLFLIFNFFSFHFSLLYFFFVNRGWYRSLRVSSGVCVGRACACADVSAPRERILY